MFEILNIYVYIFTFKICLKIFIIKIILPHFIYKDKYNSCFLKDWSYFPSLDSYLLKFKINALCLWNNFSSLFLTLPTWYNPHTVVQTKTEIQFPKSSYLHIYDTIMDYCLLLLILHCLLRIFGLIYSTMAEQGTEKKIKVKVIILWSTHSKKRLESQR